MLYIEDFLELIEPFPQEIRERLTEMRETDLQIQNESDKLDERIKIFFQQCKKQKSEWKNQNYEEIRTEYSKLLENADDKIQITDQLYELIEKYLKKLDVELQKFKLELEADHAGITSKLEQVISSTIVNENSPNNSDGINGNCSMNSGSVYNYGSGEQNSDFTLNSTTTTNELMKMMAHNTNVIEASINSKTNTPSQNKRKNSSHIDKARLEDDESNSSWNSKQDTGTYQSSNGTNPTFHFSNSNKKSALIANKKNPGPHKSQSLQHQGANSLNKLIRTNNNICLGQATTKQRTTSTNKSNNKSVKADKSQRIKKTKLIDLDYEDELKYDYFENESLKHDNLQKLNDPNNDLYTNDLNEETSETTGTSETDIAHVGRLLNNEDEFETDSSENEIEPVNSNLDNNEDTTNSDLENKMKINKRSQNVNRHFKEDWNSGEDTNEHYCICKDISYGDMIMCDNSRCETQWFHFVCVGLNAAPKGKWFCPFCVDSKKKKKEKQLSTILNASGPITSPSIISTINKISNQSDFLPSTGQASNSSPFLSTSSSFATNFTDKKF